MFKKDWLEEDDLWDVIDEIVYDLDLDGVRATPRGYSFCCPSPDHDDLKPSASIDTHRGLWNCFGCGEAGNVYHLVSLAKGISTVEARKYCIEIKEKGDKDLKKKTKIRILRKPLLQDIPISLVDTFHSALVSNKERLKEIGEFKGWDDQVIKKMRLGWSMTHSRYTIPVFDTEGKCRNIRLYSTKRIQGHPKVIHWNNQAKKAGATVDQSTILNENVVSTWNKGDTVFVCAGETDCIRATQLGLNAISLIQGETAKIHDTLRDKLQHLLSAFRVGVVYDTDSAGRNGARNVLEALDDKCVEAKNLVLPLTGTEGKDLCDYLAPATGRTGDALLDLFGQAPRCINPGSILESQPFTITNSRFCSHVQELRFTLTQGPFSIAMSFRPSQLTPKTLATTWEDNTGLPLEILGMPHRKKDRADWWAQLKKEVIEKTDRVDTFGDDELDMVWESFLKFIRSCKKEHLETVDGTKRMANRMALVDEKGRTLISQASLMFEQRKYWNYIKKIISIKSLEKVHLEVGGNETALFIDVTPYVAH